MSRALRAVGAFGLLAAAGAGGWLVGRSREPDQTAAPKLETATAEVIRTDLATKETFDGELRYIGTRTVTAAAPGTITALPDEASRPEAGAMLFELNGTPVILLAGERPAWRPFAAGMSPGPDVLQLEENLAALGHGEGLTVDREFTEETADALETFREASGLPEGRSIELGAVSFLPGPIRVGALLTQIGASVVPGAPLFEVSSIDQEVVIELDPTNLDVVEEGASVDVILPDEESVTGTIVDVGRVARPVSPEPDAPRIIEVRIELEERALDLDRAPVEVEVVTQLADDVLAVPVKALLALSDGGYAVEVDHGTEKVLVGVELGAFAEGLVEVRGGLSEGDLVVIPK